MKSNLGTLMGFAVLLGVGGYVVLSQQSEAIIAVNEQPATEEVVTPEWMQDADAIAAAEAVVKRKALEAERAELVSEREAIEAEAKAKVDAIKARVTELDKELGTY